MTTIYILIIDNEPIISAKNNSIFKEMIDTLENDMDIIPFSEKEKQELEKEFKDFYKNKNRVCFSVDEDLLEEHDLGVMNVDIYRCNLV